MHGSGCAISRWEKWAISSEGSAAHVARLGVSVEGVVVAAKPSRGAHVGSHVDTLRSSDCCPPLSLVRDASANLGPSSLSLGTWWPTYRWSRPIGTGQVPRKGSRRNLDASPWNELSVLM